MEILNQRNYINNQLHFESEFNRNAEFKGKFPQIIFVNVSYLIISIFIFFI